MLEMREVLTRADRKRFIQFQNDLYKDCPNYVPTLMMDELTNIDPNKNPAYEYCEARQWLAYRDGAPVGRIGAIISHAANSKWNNQRIRFTRIDFIEDYEVFCLLMKTVEDWARERGLTEIIGPIGYCDFDKEGMLVDGFEHMGLFITYYNYPYYVEFMQRYGFEKEVDWLENKVYIGSNDKVEQLERICARVEKKLGIRYIHLKNKRQVKPYIPQIFALIDECYAHLFGTVPLTPRQVEFYTGQFLSLLNYHYIGLVVDENDKLISFGLLAPSLVEPMRKSGGRLFPFGWIPLLRTIRHPKALDMYFIAVKTEYQQSGVPALLLHHIHEIAQKNGVEYAESGPELEQNYNVLGLWNGYRIEKNFKRRRCWKKQITPEV